MLPTKIQNIVNGRIGEYRIASEILLKGYNVLIPSVDNGTDLVLGNGKHIQVKSSHSGSFVFNSAKSKSARRRYGKDVPLKPHLLNVDIVILWCVIPNEFYVIPVGDIRGVSGISLQSVDAYKRWKGYLNNWSVLGEADNQEINGGILGKAGEFRVISELMVHGHSVSLPIVDDGADLYMDGNKGIQVKTAKMNIANTPYIHRNYNFNVKLSSISRGLDSNQANHVRAHPLDGVSYVILWAVDDSFYIIPVDKIRGRVGLSFTADHDKRTQLKWNRYLPYRDNWGVLDGKLPYIKENIEFKCKQCGYTWIPYVENPTRCPKCHCRWRIDRPRKMIDGKVAPMTKEEISEMNRTECARVRWMKVKNISIEEVNKHKPITCRQCGYSWIPIADNPRRCARCGRAWFLEPEVKVSQS